MFSGPAISVFYLVVKLGIFAKLKKEKISVYGILVLSLNPILIVIQNQSYIFVDSLTSFSILVLIYLYSFPYIEKLNKLLFSIPLIVAILHIERNLLLQLMICEVMLVWMAYSIYEQMIRQYKSSRIVNLTFLNIFVTHLVEILILFAYVEKIAGYQEITVSLVILSAIFLFFSTFFPQLVVAKFSFLWNYPPFQDDNIEKNIVAENLEDSSKNPTKRLAEDFELTEREQEVLEFIAKGHTSKEISEKMYLSKKTIDHYRAAIKEKLGYSKRSELVEFVLLRTDSASPKNQRMAKTSKKPQEEHIST